ncbi:DUF2934 domain-containing protein [Burkholderia sp. Nafp2/4-1b]|uniref:DUF2934 domain-containing protein n=1 Tax=Burkholderia sp. Nafp2/4-1b TaxID=2116686 RepID=UPI000EF93AFE|nr:DUF2934 domain-containing protein [Burkholderia sp. Nafp2/4-1b]RKU00114.1 DUF2934 domain-containing protein [Burkholderia sp. Nafp2/4-1b]
MNQDRETQIRERAYRLWQADGEPDGRADEYWQRAEQEFDAQESGTAAEGSADERASAQGRVDDDAEPATDWPITQSAKRRIPGDPLQEANAVPPAEVAHEKRRKR